jgi:ribulose-bisphosphate carboxylase large chain
MTIQSPALETSGDRLVVSYLIQDPCADALKRAADICVEQTIEFPQDLVDGDIRTKVIGRVEDVVSIDAGNTRVEISYAWELCANEFPQFLNVVFGNISIQPGIRVLDFQLPECAPAALPGPLYGVAGLRERHQALRRPLIATALKPLGLDSKSLAKMAYELASGGMDIIKDDHGLSDQPFAPFRERVQYCAEAVQEANARTGYHSAYYPNISCRQDRFIERAAFAQEQGAGGYLLAPGLVSWDAVHWLRSQGLNLPVMIHPTFYGTYVMSPSAGITHRLQYGKLVRLSGADLSIFPNFGGRFSFSQEECRQIKQGCLEPMGTYRPIFPAPGGGMKLSRIEEIIRFYGMDCTLLIGGDLHRGESLASATRQFLQTVSEVSERMT